MKITFLTLKLGILPFLTVMEIDVLVRKRFPIHAQGLQATQKTFKGNLKNGFEVGLKCVFIKLIKTYIS